MKIYVAGFLLSTEELNYGKEFEVPNDEIKKIMNWESIERNIGAEFPLVIGQVNMIERVTGHLLPKDLALFLSIG